MYPMSKLVKLLLVLFLRTLYMLEPGTYIMRLSSWKQFLAGYDGNGNPINKAVMQAKPYRSWTVRMYGFNIKVKKLKLSI